MRCTIALAGNPNSGKTTLFNALTGANQFVGNWPGVTVEKKEGLLKKHHEITIADLPGIYSLSPYSPEEVIARTFLVEQAPAAIINIVDGTNLERNLYLTTQLMELGLPMVVAVNMMDEVDKAGDQIDVGALSKQLGCPVRAISALKGTGLEDLIKTALSLTQEGAKVPSLPEYGEETMRALRAVEEGILTDASPKRRRWYAVKLLEKDAKVEEKLGLDPARKEQLQKIQADFESASQEDGESAIIAERYAYIARTLKSGHRKKARALTTSDKIDRVVTNRFLALPIFAVVMFLVYYVSVTTIGALVTDWTNDGLFGDGYFFFGRGRPAYEEAVGEYEDAGARAEAFLQAAKDKGLDPEAEDFSKQAEGLIAEAVFYEEDGETVARKERVDLAAYQGASEMEEPEPTAYGPWLRGVPVVVSSWLESANVAPWLQGLIVDGIIAGVGAVLGFVPQIFVLFIFLAILEACGYMARIAFIMDRVFRRFGLSGKSFIPMLIGTGCSVPGIMAARTIEQERDRRMTVMTTSFIPCGAKLPVIAMIAGAIFGGAWWVAYSAYFVGIAAVIISGIILKKTRGFRGKPAPFVMELPAYRVPTVGNVLRSMWERGWSFIKKAGSIILISSIFIWFISYFGVVDGKLVMLEAMDIDKSFAAGIGGAIAWLFKPLGFGEWKSAIATVMGLVAKENVVNTFGILFGYAEVAEDGAEIWQTLAAHYTGLAAYAMLVFNLLCAPCFAAIGAMKREMNHAGWTTFAIAYQTLFAYAVTLILYQLGLLFGGFGFTLWTAIAFALLAILLYLLLRPNPENRMVARTAPQPT